MNKIFRRLAPIFILLIFSCFALGSDFKSEVIPPNQPCNACPIRVHGDQRMLIRNFTQEGGSDRGIVTVTKPPSGDTATVLTAAILDPLAAQGQLEVINSVIIAGPAEVMITCGSDAMANCFVSYKKVD